MGDFLAPYLDVAPRALKKACSVMQHKKTPFPFNVYSKRMFHKGEVRKYQNVKPKDL
jgi:hypothetical protein